MDKETNSFFEDKKESISLVIYQISQMDKSLTALTERLDVITNRMEMRISSLELWRAGIADKVATQDQIENINSKLKPITSIIWAVGSLILLGVGGALLSLVLKK